nr:MAG TPA: hypothetical protein [Caudoviricetes sp.]
MKVSYCRTCRTLKTIYIGKIKIIEFSILW